ncbi:MAG: hypothetical protein ACRDKY_04155, partial [Solirubrobacteraceae bacterium]
APLLRFLDSRAEAAVRVEVPFTRLHWESVHVAKTTPLARGWVTQLDRKYNPLFRPGKSGMRLTPARYRSWLRREGVAYVALPDVPLDPSGRAEARLIRRGPPYLRLVHRDRHWRIYAVVGSPGLADGAGRLTKIGPQSFSLRSSRPGFTLVRVRFTPYWRVARGHACVTRARGGWTLVYSLRAGDVKIDVAFAARDVFERSGRCAHVPKKARVQL